jgi:hypothetical protein
VSSYFHVEICRKKLKEVFSFNIGIQSVGSSSEYEQRSEEIDEDSVHNRVIIDGFLYHQTTLTQYSEKFHDELFKLKIIENLWIIFFIEHELKSLVIDYFLDLSNVGLKINVLEFEAQFEVLIIEDSNIGLRIIREVFHNS